MLSSHHSMLRSPAKSHEYDTKSCIAQKHGDRASERDRDFLGEQSGCDTVVETEVVDETAAGPRSLGV